MPIRIAEMIEKTVLSNGFFPLILCKVRHTRFAGGMSRAFTREVLFRAPVAAVLPYDPVRDAVILIEQFRAGKLLSGAADPWMIEVVAGIIEDGETPEAMVRREAVETRNIGRYKLLRRLGTGGMGDVWEAFDITLRQQVALKTVYGHRPGSPVAARLEREVRALSELSHPNIVRVFDYGVTDDGLCYYAMELLHGQTLQELVAREGPLSVERLLLVARQVLRALGEAHAKGIIHRDIKPENVFVTQPAGGSEIVKLLDFGIARSSGDTQLTNTGCVAGTPAYMAPETILGQPADVRSDIYSFGATLYYAVSARRPFPEEDSLALFAAHVNRPLERVSSIAKSPIPAALERAIERCMAKNPADRFGSTHALLEALLALDDERPPSRPTERRVDG